MIKLNQIRLTPAQCVHEDKECTQLKKKSARILNIPITAIQSLTVMRKALDARKKPDLFYTFSVAVSLTKDLEKKLLRRHADNPNITSYTPPSAYILPEGRQDLMCRPVVVGMGPAGLFCAYYLAKAGFRPIVLERGESVDERRRKVNRFWQSGILDPECNVQFGEGGAGTFSDGKLNTLIKDPVGRNRKVLEIFVENGAPKDILYVNKPHIGTDILRTVIRNMREKILVWGGEIHFHTQMTEVLFTENTRRIRGIVYEDLLKKEKEEIQTETLVLAPGHSARETFAMLFEKKVPMEAKSFAVGVRAEHPQELINHSQYGDAKASLPAAAYKLTAKLPDGRGVYSFCMCPGGYVVNASSEEGYLAVNGMSYHARDSHNANSAIVVTVTPEDFESDHPLAGIAFQRKLEKAAYKAGKGKIPVQRYGDFYRSVTGKEKGKTEAEVWYQGHEPCMKGAYEETDLAGIFPAKISSALVDGMEDFNKKIRGFSHPLSILSGVESRTSSPVRIVRDNHSLESVIGGLYPCGEGAGYAGGITSAAADGIKIAEKIRQKYAPFL